MLKSAFASGIAWGLGLSSLWLIPVGFAHLTGTGTVGFSVCTLVLLLIAAAVAEVRARRRKV
ncbi:hypothetical protein [Stenotrophomonas maltophilia]|uniref:Transmembrane protein n=1 Tax=Stenotrophomonas maltophilia TaxID=40324 RepID=A0A4S2D3U7_STEMA|nr:hypothetical protein [Stenotrophomonas maltophilia]TGY35233.1 hypothetical protein E5352_05800 [Stenotrophomonas maltophilia]